MLTGFKRLYRRVSTAWWVLAVGLALSVGAAWLMAQRVAHEAQLQFDAEVADTRDAISTRIQAYTDVLRGVRALFDTRGVLVRDEFRRYVQSIDLGQRYPGIQVIHYSQRISDQQRSDFEAKVRFDTSVEPRGYPGFAIKSPGERPEYVVVQFVEPMAGNEAALGLDLGGDAVRMAALNRTRDSGQLTASGAIALALDPHKHPGFAMRLALYHKGAPLATLAQRREAFVGVVSASFVVIDLMRGSLSDSLLQKIHVQIHDAGFLDDLQGLQSPSADNLMFDSDRLRDPIATSRVSDVVNDPAPGRSRLDLDIGGRRWNLYFNARQDGGTLLERALPWMVLLVGLTISLLISGLIQSLAATGRRSVELAARITEHLRQSEASLVEANRMTQQLIEALPIPIFFKDTEGHYLGVNQAWEAYFSTPRDEFLGKTVYELYPANPEVAERLTVKDLELWAQPGHQTYETEITTRNSQQHNAIFYKATFTRADGSVAGLIGTIIDITERKRAEAQVLRLAQYDELTSLPNRNMFQEHVMHALARAKRNSQQLALLFIDLDDFKKINDTLGHDAGDRVLKLIAERLRGCLRESDTVCRLGGDEFVVLVDDLQHPESLAEMANKILSAISLPFVVNAGEYHLSASIGISTYPVDSTDMQGLMKCADIAMYRAKEQGKNEYRFYSVQMNVHSLERLALESDLRHALQRDEFRLHYQPKYDIASGRIVGAEALLRWERSPGVLVPPSEFIPLAEQTGLIVPIGEWVTRRACQQGRAWQQAGLPRLSIAVNLSARQFTQDGLLKEVERALHDTQFDPTLLEFEITESMLMHDPEQSAKMMGRLKWLGIRLSIDDFGTGYSSLSYLRRFSLDSLKIDRSFTQDLPGDADVAAITRAIIAMAHSLRLKVIAEGVETGPQLAFLREEGCDEMQGFLLSKPLPEAEFARLFKSGP
jgi:diguanylate cyclase (GGDEF)-like protein/PAS domain S-box-containing protein